MEHPGHLREFARIFGKIKDHSFGYALEPCRSHVLSLSREAAAKELPQRQAYAVQNGFYHAALSTGLSRSNNGAPSLSSQADIQAFLERMEIRADLIVQRLDGITIPDDVLTALDETGRARSRVIDTIVGMLKVSTDDSIITPLKASVDAMDQKLSELFSSLQQQFSDVLDLIADRKKN
jgi:hypothetical protein